MNKQKKDVQQKHIARGINELIVSEESVTQEAEDTSLPHGFGFNANGGAVSFDLDALRIDMTKDAAPPNYLCEAGRVGIIPSGELIAFTGAAKHGKTQFVNILASVILSRNPFGNIYPGYDPLSHGGGIVWIDTEQSIFNIQRNLKRLQHIGGLGAGDTDKWGLNVYATRQFDAVTRREIMVKAVERHNPSVLIIDGLRDLLRNFNDEGESIDLMNWLNAIVVNNRVTAFVVIHTNDGSTKMRGHLGSELLNKCADRFLITKDTKRKRFGVQQITRNDAMDDFYFEFDEKGNLIASGEAE